jgi:predicted metal-dependent hydrolase
MQENIGYTLRRSSRARHMRLVIRHDGSLVVTAPHVFSLGRIEGFIADKAEWIRRTVAYFKSLPQGFLLKTKRGDYVRHKEAARALAVRRLAHFNDFYGFDYKTISIRNQKTRWGSCSKSGSLSFNDKIALLPAELADYVIVHELCHLREFNHSAKFWDLVARTVPDYARLRKKLKGVRTVS